MIVAISAIAITLVSGSTGATTACDASSKLGDLCACSVLELHPTQFAVGMIGVKDMEAGLASKPGPALSA